MNKKINKDTVRKNLRLSKDLAKDAQFGIDHYHLDDFNQYMRMLIRRDVKEIKSNS